MTRHIKNLHTELNETLLVVGKSSSSHINESPANTTNVPILNEFNIAPFSSNQINESFSSIQFNGQTNGLYFGTEFNSADNNFNYFQIDHAKI